MSSGDTVGDASVEEFDFEHRPETDQSFENALAKAHDGTRLGVADAIELLTTGTEHNGIDTQRKEQVLEIADRRRAEVVGEEVTFVANLNNNVTTACNTGCLSAISRTALSSSAASTRATTAGSRRPPRSPALSSPRPSSRGSTRSLRCRACTQPLR